VDEFILTDPGKFILQEDGYEKIIEMSMYCMDSKGWFKACNTFASDRDVVKKFVSSVSKEFENQPAELAQPPSGGARSV
jgi:hypothetical protein